MSVLSCIRDYYLYVYYHGSFEPDTKKVFPPRGLLFVTFLVMAFHALTILYAFNALGVEFINGSIKEQIFSFRGNVNLLIIMAAVLAVLLTYFVCCFGIKFEEIKSRLAKTKCFRERSILKMILLPILSMALFILSGVLFY